MKEKQTGYAIATLILIVPCMLANIWFMKEIWNIGLIPIFNQLPELTFKTTAILYIAKAIFGLSYTPAVSHTIQEMINKKRTSTEYELISMSGTTVGYLLIYLIIRVLV
jgi:hypothetical protein